MAKMRWFLRETTVGREPLAVSMTSVRPGERVLQIGANDPAIVHAIANKAGITGLATIVVPNDGLAARVRGYSGEDASSTDVRIEPLDRLPFEDRAYDAVILHNTEGLLRNFDPHLRQQALHEWLRVLRVGGRLIVLDAGRPTGMLGLLAGGRRESADATTSALQMAGFTSVRVLGDREGYRFVEGVRPH
jgi:ubiquinone/menaquinone biosynthesis C-methylase UbiE